MRYFDGMKEKASKSVAPLSISSVCLFLSLSLAHSHTCNRKTLGHLVLINLSKTHSIYTTIFSSQSTRSHPKTTSICIIKKTYLIKPLLKLPSCTYFCRSPHVTQITCIFCTWFISDHLGNNLKREIIPLIENMVQNTKSSAILFQWV